MAGADNDTLFGTGLDLSGLNPVVNRLGTNGFLYFGNSAGNPQAGLPTSVNDTIEYIGGEGTGRFENRRWITPFVVDASSAEGSRGTYTTIQAAIAAASSGDTIFVRPGTYTENLTLKNGVTLVSMESRFGEQPEIVGKCSISSGTCIIIGLKLTTNSDFAVSSTGTSSVTCSNCLLSGTNNTIIEHTSSSSFRLSACGVNLSTSGISVFTSTGSGDFSISRSSGSNASSTTASTISAGTLRLEYNNLPHSFSLSGSSRLIMIANTLEGSPLNLVGITTAGTNVNHTISNSRIESGTSSAISIGSGTTLTISNSSINSSNTNPITGAGTIIYSGVSFSSTGNEINTTTQNTRYNQLGKYRAMGQPFFLAQAVLQSNVTGDNTTYTVQFTTEIKDQSSNYDGTSTFTAPVTGSYQLNFLVAISNYSDSTHSRLNASIVTSNRTYSVSWNTRTVASSGIYKNGCSILCDMDEGDTATCTVSVFGSSKTVNVITDSFFSGSLLN